MISFPSTRSPAQLLVRSLLGDLGCGSRGTCTSLDGVPTFQPQEDRTGMPCAGCSCQPALPVSTLVAPSPGGHRRAGWSPAAVLIVIQTSMALTELWVGVVTFEQASLCLHLRHLALRCAQRMAAQVLPLNRPPTHSLW